MNSIFQLNFDRFYSLCGFCFGDDKKMNDALHGIQWKPTDVFAFGENNCLLAHFKVDMMEAKLPANYDIDNRIQKVRQALFGMP